MSSRSLLGWAAGVTLLLVQRPLFAPNLWWDLSRGREVASGSFSPCRELLSLDVANEADWCSGLLFYIGWTCGGIHVLSAVPLLAAMTLLLFLWHRIRANLGEAIFIVILPLVLWTVRDGLQPVPQLFDLLGMVVIWCVVNSSMSTHGRLVSLLLTFLVWGNLGPRPVWGLLWLICTDWTAPGKQSSRTRDPKVRRGETIQGGTIVRSVPSRLLMLQVMIVALLGGSITPRGLLTWWDSVILLSPGTFANLESYGERTWSGSFRSGHWTTAEWAFALLWCLWVGMKFPNSPIRLPKRGDPEKKVIQYSSLQSLSGAAGCCVPLLAGVLSQDNLPLCGLWILLDLLRVPNSLPIRSRVTSRWRQLGLVSTAIFVLCPVVVDASGLALPPFRRLGWGISQEIDPRLLDVSLLALPNERAIGWAPDGRSVGLVTWLDGNVKLADHPQRALLGGRVPLHAALMADLLGSHRARYRRDDGTWGGWVHQMAEWQVAWLFIPVEMQRLHRELTKTTWRPLDLDSPTMPFASADDPNCSAAILETMRQQGFVELGPWQPTLEIYDGLGWRFDAVEMCGGDLDPSAAIRQSQLFRAMDIPLASLRALLPVRQKSRHRSLADEFRACQIDLAYQEWITFGEASYFRRLVVQTLMGDQVKSNVPWLVLKADEEAKAADAWVSCVSHYLRGHLEDAVDVLPLQTSSEHLAAAMLWLELGESRQAQQELHHAISTSQDQAVLIAAQYWHLQVGPFAGP